MIEISEELYVVHLSTTIGWVEQVSPIVTIGEFEYSITPKNTTTQIILVVSEVLSGGAVYEEQLDLATFVSCDTQEATLELFKAIAERAYSRKIKHYSNEKMSELVIEAKRKAERSFGPMPKNNVLYVEGL